MKKQVFCVISALLVSVTAYAAIGDEFKVQTVEGVEMLFSIIGDKTVQVGSEYYPDQTIPHSYQGGITIPSSVLYENKEYVVTTIAGKAFMDCTGLTSVVIPSSVTDIYFGAFLNCTSLASIEFQGSPTNIGEGAFNNTAWFNNQEDGVVYLGNIAYKYKGAISSDDIVLKDGTTQICPGAFNGYSGITSIEIPNSVTNIGSYAFYGTGIITIQIPNSVTNIGSYAFQDCRGLTSISIGSGVCEIGDDAFNRCTAIEEIRVDKNNAKYDSRNNCNAIIETESNTLIIGCKNTIIPQSVSNIGERSFMFCSGLTSIDIPDGVTTIGGHAFYQCNNLASLMLPSSLTKIDYQAFQDCTQLKSINFSEGLVNIENSAFYGCSSIQSVSLPNSLTSIGSGAFCGCSSLTSIEIPQKITNIGESAFYGCTSITAIRFNCSEIGAWFGENKYEYGSYSFYPYDYVKKIQNVTIGQHVQKIGDNALYNFTGLTSIEIPNSVTTIGEKAFAGCTSLASVNIPNGVTSIGDWAFYGCKMKSITIPESISFIGNRAFNMIDLEAVTIKEGVKYIGGFSNCKKLSRIDIPNSVTTIGESAFYGCSGLSEITIPGSVTLIKENAFDECNNIKKLVLDDGTKTLRFEAKVDYYTSKNKSLWFRNCDINYVYLGRYIELINNINNSQIVDNPIIGNKQNINMFKIGESVSKIDYTVLSGCTNLTSIEIPNSVTIIGNRTFMGCTGLTSIEIPNSVQNIGDAAFMNCTNLTHLTVGKGVISMGQQAVDNCVNLKTVEFHCLTIKAWIHGKVSINEIVIGEEVETIGANAFSGCISLPSVKIPNSVTTISERAFSGCTSLTSIEIPNGVEEIGENAFEGCTNLIQTIFHCKTIKDWKYGNNLQEITIGADVDNITGAAFNMCYNLNKVIIEDGDNTLFFGGISFYGSPVETLYLGRNISYVENNVPFSRNKEGLQYLEIGPKVSEIIDKEFLGHRGLKSLKFSEGLKKIGDQAFYGCEGLTELEIPGSVIEIGQQAFDLCSGLKKVRISDGAETLNFTSSSPHILNNSFTNSPLEQIYIGRDFSFYGNSPFGFSETLSLITLGSALKNLPSKAFAGCSNLLDVYAFSEDVPKTGESVFTESYLGNASLHVPEVSYKTYYENNPWNKFGKLFAMKSDEEKEVFKIVFMIDGETYAEDVELEGNIITSLEVPEREGYTFSGWDGLPEKMPAGDVTVLGRFTVNSYTLTYILDGEKYKTVSVEYGSNIDSEVPEREGYTFSGWDGLPETMPAEDVTATGTFTINSYTLTYILDGEEYKAYTIEYGSSITAENAPEKEGYTFSGWESLPSKMPAENVTVTGTFTINQYTITYIIDGEVFYTESIDYGSEIVPPSVPERSGYDFAWEDYPETVPANDVIIYGSYTTGIARIMVDRNVEGIYSMDGKRLSSPQHGVNIIRMKDGTVKRVMVK